MGYFPFLGGSFNGRSLSFDAQRTVNLIPVRGESGTSRSPLGLFGSPGLLLWQTLTGQGVRGAIVISPDLAIIIAGDSCFRIKSDGTFTKLGTVTTNSPIASMAYNGTVVMMVDGSSAYIIDPAAGTCILLADPNFLGAVRVDFVDGYFVWNVPGTGTFQISGLYSTAIDPLDYATAEGSPDNLVVLIVDHREIWLFGNNTTEIWINVGDPDFPFQRVQGAFLEIGCAAPYSVAKADNSLFWLATDDRGFGTIQRAAGYSPVRVSNDAVDYAIAQYQASGAISDAVAYTYSQEGHLYYVISFPSANAGRGATWVLDVSTQLWHERAWRDPVTGQLGRHRSNVQINFAGKTLVGDWENPLLYVLDLDTFTDNGNPLPAIRVCQHIADDGKNVFFMSLELMMQTGVGLATGQGSDPQARLSWSDDGGYTWSSEVSRSIGKIGETRARVRWLRLGRGRDRVFKVEITDPVRRVFTSCDLATVPALS